MPVTAVRRELGAGLVGGAASSVQDAGCGPDVQVEGDADVGVPGQAGDVAGLDLPGEQRGGAEDVSQAMPGPGPAAVFTAPSDGPVGGHEDPAAEVVRAPVLALG